MLVYTTVACTYHQPKLVYIPVCGGVEGAAAGDAVRRVERAAHRRRGAEA
jgi:hypothetical protein